MRNLHIRLLQGHGKGSVTFLKELEYLVKKMAHFGNHQRSILRCLDYGFILVSCKLKSPIRIPNSYRIIKRAEKQLMYNKVRNINYILYMLKMKRDTCKNKLTTILSMDQDLFSECLEFMDKIKQVRHIKSL